MSKHIAKNEFNHFLVFLFFINRLMRWATTNPLQALITLLFIQVVAAFARDSARNQFSEFEDLSKEFDVNDVDLDVTDVTDDLVTRDVTKELAVTDVTELYRERRLQDLNSSCNSGVVPIDAWGLMLGNTGIEQGYSLALYPDNRIIAAGVAGWDSYESLLAQFNPDGSLIWAKRLGGSTYSFGYDVKVRPDGRILLVSTNYGFGAGNNDFMLSQFYPNGTFDFARTSGGSGDDSPAKLILRSDGKAIVVGATNSYGAGNYDILITQHYTDGTVERSVVVGGANDDFGNALAFLSGGQIAITGYTVSAGAGGKDLVVMILDANLNVVRVGTVGGTKDEVGNAVLVDTDDQIWVVGSSNSFTKGDRDVLLVQVYANGTLKSAITFGGSQDEVGNALARRSNGKILLGGSTTSFGAGGNDALFMQFYPNSILDWVAAFGGTAEDSCSALALRSDDRPIFIGSATDVYGTNRPDVLLAQFSSANDIPTLASGYAFTSISLGDIDVVDISKNVSLQVWSLTSSTVTLTQKTWNTYRILDIPASAVTPLSLLLNTSAFSTPADSVLIFQYRYLFPAAPFLYVGIQPKLSIDATNANWLSYDSDKNQLTGTPIETHTGQQSITLLSEAMIISSTVGAIYAKAQMNFCVRPTQSLNPWSAGTFGLGNNDFGEKLAVRADGQLLVLGTFGGGSNYPSGSMLSLFYPNGSMVWTKSLNFDANAMSLRPDGSILLTGDLNHDVALVELSSHGQVNWATAVGSAYDYGNSLVLYPDGRAVVVGVTTCCGASTYEIFLAQYSVNGTVLWGIRLGGAIYDYGYKVALLSDGSIILGASTYGRTTGSLWDILVSSINENGTIGWAKTLGGTAEDQITALVPLPNNHILVGGYTASYGAGNFDALIAQFDNSGNFEWTRTLGGVGDDYCNALVVRPDGKKLITGYTANYGAGGKDLFIGLLDANGNVIWLRAIGGVKDDQGNDVVLLSDGSMVLTGGTYSFGAGNSDALLLLLNENGYLANPTPVIQDISNVQSLAITPTVTNVKSSVTRNVLGLTAQNATITTATIPLLSNSLLPVFFQTPLAPIQWGVYGQAYQLDFRNYLFSSTAILRVNELGKSTLPGWLTYNPLSKVLTGMLSGNIRGKYFIEMNLQNNNQQQGVTFIINIPNTAPYYLGNTTFNTSTGRFVFPLGSYMKDNEADLLYPFSLAPINGVLPPAIASLDVNSGRLFGTALSGDQGSYQFNVTVADPYGGFVWELITLNVLNADPQLDILFDNPPPVTVGQPFTFSFARNAFIDTDGDGITYHAIYPSFLTFDRNTRTLYGTPLAQHRGKYNFTIFASDSYGGQSSVTLVLDVNGIPIQQFTLGVLATSPVGMPYSYTLPSGLHVDPDGDSITYTLFEDIQHIVPSWLRFNSSSNTFVGTPNSNNHQSIPTRLQVSDGRGGVLYYDVDFSIPNSMPVVVAGIADQTISVNQIKTLVIGNAVFFDADADPLTYRLELADGTPIPAWISLATNTINFVPRAGAQGDYSLRLFANDGYGETDTLFSVHIPNDAPMQVEDLPQVPVVTVGNSFNYVFSATAFKDPNNDGLTYSVRGAPGFLSFNPNTRTLLGTPQAADRGSYLVDVLASDPYAAQVAAQILIVINGVPSQQIALGLLSTTLVGSFYFFALPAGLFVDPDDDAMSYVLYEDLQHIVPSWLKFNSSNNIFYGVPNSNNHQIIPIRLQVSDGRGGVAYCDLSFTIPNSAPVASSLADQMISVDQTKSMVIPAGTFVDPDGDRLIYGLQAIGGQAQNWLSLANDVLTFFPKSGNQGSYSFELIARDSYGGEASLIFRVIVPNRNPVLMYAIPTPGIAYSKQTWSFILEAGNFFDGDNDPLTFIVLKADGTPLPVWINFDSGRRLFAGIPQGIDRGIIPLMVKVIDGFGGEAVGYFNVTVANSVPVPVGGRVFDQQVSGTEASYSFTVPVYEDPDGDNVDYSARMHDGTALPSWLSFDARSRLFNVKPNQAVPGNYLIDLIATDSLGLSQINSFNLAIQAPPNIDLNANATTEALKNTSPVISGVGLLTLLMLLLGGRKWRIRNTNAAIRDWSSKLHVTVAANSHITFTHLCEELESISDVLIKRSVPLAEIEVKMQNFRLDVLQYYKSNRHPELITTLLDLGIMPKLLGFVERSLTETPRVNYSSERTLITARLLHIFLNLLLSEHTGRKNKLSHKAKELFLAQLNALIARVRGSARESIEILYELHSAREALICTVDTNTLLLLCKTSLTHILSPGALLDDISRLIFDFPSAWYVSLLEMKRQALLASSNLEVLKAIQHVASQQSDWRFLFGMIGVLNEIILQTIDSSIRKQAFRGEVTVCGITYLGFLQLLKSNSSWLCCHRNGWIRRQAFWVGNQLYERLDREDQKLFDALSPEGSSGCYSKKGEAQSFQQPEIQASPFTSTATRQQLRRATMFAPEVGDDWKESPLPMAAKVQKGVEEDRIVTNPMMRDRSIRSFKKDSLGGLGASK